MTMTTHSMDMDKVLEAILFVASKVPEPTFHKIAKIFWFADKLHLQRYGFILSGDTYHAMNNGPVPSKIYDMLKLASGTIMTMDGIDTLSVRNAMSMLNDGCTVQVKRSANVDFLSEAEVECLVDAMTEHGSKTFAQLSRESHDSAWKSVPKNAAIPFKEIVKTLPNAKELESFLYA